MRATKLFFFFSAILLVFSGCSKSNFANSESSGSDAFYAYAPMDTNGAPTTINFGTNTYHEEVVTLRNPGQVQIQDISVSVAPITPFLYKGGTYPGTGGTCGTTLNIGATCTIVLVMQELYMKGSFSYKTHIRYRQSSTYRSLVLTLTGTGTRTCTPQGFSSRLGETFYITSIEELNNVRCTKRAGAEAFVLNTDLDLQDVAIAPIGTPTNPVTSFDGTSHTISNYRFVNPRADYIGLFGYNAGNITSLNIQGFYIQGRDFVGAVVGSATQPVRAITISDTTVIGRDNVGGVIGFANAQIDSFTVAATVSGRDYIGGIAGANMTTLENGSFTGTVTGRNHVGGLLGLGSSTWGGGVTSSTITGTTAVGGLIGYGVGHVFNTSVTTTSVSGTGDYAGGLIGYAASNAVWDVWANASVSGNNAVGGLIGQSGAAKIYRALAYGAVSGSTWVGGAVGRDISSTSAQVVYDSQTTGQNSSAIGTAKTTAEMKSVATYEGFDAYTVWDISAGSYPSLRLTGNKACVSGAGGFAGGSGTSGSPYQIATIDQLYNITCNSNKYYILTADLDFANHPSLRMPETLYGTLDGDNHTISNWKYESPYENYVGLFKNSYGTIKNLTISNFTSTGFYYVGSLVAYANASGTQTLANLTVSGGTIKGSQFVGGLAGATTYQVIDNCSSSATVQSILSLGNGSIGGLIGNTTYSQVKDSSTSGNVTGESYTGGLVGYAYYSANGYAILNSHATGTVSGSSQVGGLVGRVSYADVANSYATGNVTATSGNAGGLIGYYQGTGGQLLSGSYATGTVSSINHYVGGLVGYMYAITLSTSYATGAISGNTYVGGLVGRADTATLSKVYATGNVTGSGNSVGGLTGLIQSATVSNAYARGSVTGQSYVGGLVGATSSATIQKTYSKGAVTGTSNLGGLTGSSSGSASDSFWDTDTSGQATSASGTGKTTTQMQTQSTFTNWDFSTIWQISAGQYPTLR